MTIDLDHCLEPEMILSERPRFNFDVVRGPAVQRHKDRLSSATLMTLAQASVRVAREQKLSTAVDFWGKSLRGPIAIATWIDFISAHHQAAGAPPPNTRVLRKPQRNYGRIGRTVWQRVDALINHYRYSATHLPAAIHRDLLRGDQIHLAKIEARGSRFDLWLASSLASGQKHEAELTVLMTDGDGVVLTRMGFSFGWDDDGAPTASIGGVQGLDSGIDKRVIVKATRALSGLRPKDAVLVSVQAIAKAARTQRLRGVSNANHVLAAEWFASDSVILRDYDAFWIERGGKADPSGGYVLPLRDYQARLKSVQTPRLIDLHRAALSEQVQAKIASG